MRVANPSILRPEAGLVTGLPPLSDATAAPPHGTARAQRTPAIAGSFFASKPTSAARLLMMDAVEKLLLMIGANADSCR
jgi:hypothetical protein